MNRIERHPQLGAINRALAGNETLAEIGARFGLRSDELCRHRSKLRTQQPVYFDSLKATPGSADAAKLIAALTEISAAFTRATRLLSSDS